MFLLLLECRFWPWCGQHCHILGVINLLGLNAEGWEVENVYTLNNKTLKLNKHQSKEYIPLASYI